MMVSHKRIQQFTLGIALALASFVCSADKQEQWNVTVGDSKSKFLVNIKNDGNFTGTSEWCCPVGINNISGVIKKNEISLVRPFSETDKTQRQDWTGTYSNDKKTIKGNYTGVGGPGTWSADVVPPTPAPAAAPKPATVQKPAVAPAAAPAAAPKPPVAPATKPATK
jgi:hypothetical protein